MNLISPLSHTSLLPLPPLQHLHQLLSLSFLFLISHHHHPHPPHLNTSLLIHITLLLLTLHLTLLLSLILKTLIQHTPSHHPSKFNSSSSSSGQCSSYDHRVKSGISKPKILLVNHSHTHILSEAILEPKWKAAMQQEYDVLIRNNI